MVSLRSEDIDAGRPGSGHARPATLPGAITRVTACGPPLAGAVAGFALLGQWHWALAAILVLAACLALRQMIGGARLETLSILFGISLYCTGFCVLWAFLCRLDNPAIGPLLAGGLLGFLSFSTWACSLSLEEIDAWGWRGVAVVSLTAAIVLVGGNG